MTTSNAYDFIIVGAGSAGSTAAYYLAQKNYSILVLERGKTQEQYPASFPASRWGENFNSEAVYDYCTQPQSGLNGRCNLLAAGQVTGGGSTINSMMYARGNLNDYVAWSESEEWSQPRLESLFEEIEQILKPESLPDNAFTSAIIKACEASGLAYNANFEKSGYVGTGHSLTTTIHGNRQSTDTAFLKPALTTGMVELLTEAHVHRILFSDKKAMGVEYIKDGQKKIASLKDEGEIILSAGALESPKILMLSGIGPKDMLTQFNIPEVHVNEEVGKNLADQPDCPVSFIALKDLPNDNNQISICAFAKSSLSKGECDLQLLFIPGEVNPELLVMGLRGFPNVFIRYRLLRILSRIIIRWMIRLFPSLKRFLKRSFTIMPCVMKPKSRGKVTLQSANPLDDLKINPNYLHEQHDRLVLMEGIQLARKIAQQSALNAWRKREFLPGKMELSDYINSFTGTTYHYAGTCAMGKVVDEKLRVIGIENLRVADAAIMPSLPLVTPNAACILIGLNLARIIFDGGR
ncbi:GMC family oxidoreductase [Aquicella lusitana]|uniref:Choline dehydrogenase n=1 Tax=Aquicella lusitana TaxID=254246 RepID=A0A370GPE5_9COXI|nr:GMC family oxidoreductase [Aquicella lusitana]RDI45229.1 choline dehydrogenase [Aquicella lusitana]VVC72701.1 Alcohol dehydrogenase [acceptor] [Aquicella lusitana]